MLTYRLKLSSKDRRAIDFVGTRYHHGSDFQRVLYDCQTMPMDAEWDDPRDITFLFEEHKAWEAKTLLELDPYLSLFSDDLKMRLHLFIDSIV